MALKPYLIAAPFGNYIRKDNCTSVLGTFTLHRRKGLWLNVIKTLRFYPGGYINKIGLRNKGIKAFVPKPRDKQGVLSIAAINYDEWQGLAEYLQQLKRSNPNTPSILELNLSCPNVDKQLTIDSQALTLFEGFELIMKLPPTELVFDFIELGLANKVRYFHLCNTIPSAKGGISGAQLREVSLALIERVNNKYQDQNRDNRLFHIIGGGGIYSTDDANRYRALGCKYLSLGTVFFRGGVGRMKSPTQ